MKKYDERKTEELLSNLKADGVEVKDLSKLFCKKIIGVRIKAARGRMSIGIDNLKTLGIYDEVGESKEVKEFKEQNISAGSFRLFNKNVVRDFDNLIANARQMIYRYSMTNDGLTYYMTVENYRDFKEVFNSKYSSKFYEMRNDLIDNLEDYKNLFSIRLKKWLSHTSLSSADINLAMTNYISKFPTAEEIKRNCIMDYYTIAYPVFNEIDIQGVSMDIADDILKDKDQSVIDTFYTLIGSSLENLFDITNKMIGTIEITTTTEENMDLKTSMSSRTKGLFNKTLDNIRNNNYLLKNDKLEKIIYLLSRTFIEKKNKQDENITNGEAVYISETLLAVIYNYAKYLGVDEMLTKDIKSSSYEEEEFELMADIDLSKL